MHASKQMMGRQLSPHTDPRYFHMRWAEASHSIHIFLLIPSAGIDLGLHSEMLWTAENHTMNADKHS